MKKNYRDYFEDLKESAEKGAASGSREDLQKELERIENEYRDAIKPSETDDKLPDVPAYERLEYDAPTDEELTEEAEGALSDFKNSGIAKIEEDAEAGKKAKEEEKLAAAEAAEKRARSVEKTYDNASRSFADDALKRGLARSSVAANKSAALEEDKAAALTQAAADAEAETRGLESEIAALSESRAKALDSFKIAYAAQLTEKIAALTEARDKKTSDVVRYNNSLLELERKAANERAKLKSELDKQNAARKPENAEEALGERNGAAYNAIRSYLSGLDRKTAAEAIKSDSLVRNALTDYYYFQLYNEFCK